MLIDPDIITTHSLPNGLRVVVRFCPSWNVECMGVAVDAGSRDDPAHLEGMAHFVEHTIFKGTSQHRASYILNRLETVGGELNAYTTKESTMIYALTPAGNMSRATSLIAELVQDSTFPEAEIDRERGVIADEIDSYLDSPSDAVVDDFEELIFRSCPAIGHNILGTKDSIEKIDSAACRNFLKSRYTASRMVFFYSGPAQSKHVINLVEKLFSTLPTHSDYHRQPYLPIPQTPEWRRDDKDLHQTHTVTGVILPGINDPRKTALSLLTNVIGGPGMNSRLNVAMRERRGLVYSVDAALGMMSDVGVMSVYFGCDREDIKKCFTLTRNIVGEVARNGLTPYALAAAKKQYSGQLILASQNAENSTLALARTTLYCGKPHTVNQTLSHIDALTIDDIQRASTLLNPDNFTTLTFL